MRKLLFAVLGVLLLVGVYADPSRSQTANGFVGSNGLRVDGSSSLIPSAIDPCGSSGVVKLSAVINLAATGKVITGTSGKSTFICGFHVTVTGTAPTLQWQNGTGSNCATGNGNLTGVYAPTAGSQLAYANSSSVFSTNTSSVDVCGIVGGTTPSVQGVISYVVQ